MSLVIDGLSDARKRERERPRPRVQVRHCQAGSMLTRLKLLHRIAAQVTLFAPEIVSFLCRLSKSDLVLQFYPRALDLISAH